MKDIKDMNIIVDASVIAYQSALCMKNINALTDSDGNPTIHINVVIAKCLNFHKNEANQFWVFDYHEKGYFNPEKKCELDKRKKIKDNAKKKLKNLQKIKDSEKVKIDELFSSDDDTEGTQSYNDIDKKNNIDKKKDIDDEINLQEKLCFSLNDKIINDIKFILNSFGIPWCDSPKGFEAESICALLARSNNAVWTTDTDAIIYGSSNLIREIKIKNKKKLILYNLDTILNNHDIDMDDLRKIAVISGSDHAPKTPGVGPKTIFKKYKDIKLTEQQKKAIKVFEKQYDITKLKWNNSDDISFGSTDNINKLLDWLECKNFNRDRIQGQIDKALK